MTQASLNLRAGDNLRSVPSSMKFLCLTGSLSRQAAGFFTSVRRLSIELSKRNLDPVVFGTFDSDFPADQTAWHPVQVRAFRTIGPARLAYAPELDTAIREEAPELIHMQGLWMMISRCNQAWHRRTQKPYLISARGMLDAWAIQHQNWKKRLVGLLYENRNLRNAACLHALSHQELEEYRAYGLKNPVAVIPNGVDLPPEGAPLHEPPWQPGDSKVLLFLGRIHSKKGILELLEGWKRVGPRRNEWKLAIAGWDDGGHAALIEQKIQAAGLEKEVLVLGPQFGTGKQACLSHAAGFILPSFSEGVPIAVLEAWANRLPVLMTPQCNLPAGFNAGAALGIEANPGSISSGLEEFFAMTDSQRSLMGAAGRQLVETSFTWEIVSAQMEATYRWLAGGGTRPASVHG